MPSITALNVRLGIDVSNFSEGVELAKSEVTKVSAVMRQSVPPTEKFQQELALLNKAFSDTGKQSAQYANAVEFLNQKHKQGKYSAEAVAAAELKVAQANQAAAMAAKHAKEETARLAEIEKQQNAILERGRAVTQSVSTAQEQHTRRVREYQSLLRSGAIDQQTYTRAVQQSGKALQQTSAASNGAIGALKGMAAAYLTVQTISKAINLASQVEDATIAFEVLTGSAKDGAILFEQIRKFSAESPITFSGATQAAKTMLSFGVAVEDVQRNLQMLSDVTGGNNERFKMLSLAFSQTTAAGRLMGQDLLQMINAGFNPLQEMAKKMAVEFGGLAKDYMPELKKRMEEGGISADEVRRAFESATAEGGMFAGMTERLSQTVSGQLNIALSDLEKKLAEAGEVMGPFILQLLDAFQQLKPVLDVVIWLIDKIAKGLGFTMAVWEDLINSISTFSIDTTATDKFLDNQEKREREIAEAKNKQIDLEFHKKIKGVEGVAAAQTEAMKKENDDLYKQRVARRAAIEEAKKAQEREAAQAEQNWQRELENARKAAMQFFDDQQKKNERRRADVARGPGSGMEAGSAEAVKFAADAVNARIAGAAVPDSPHATAKDIAAKTAELLIAQREANDLQATQIQLAEKQLAEMENNGFRRLR